MKMNADGFAEGNEVVIHGHIKWYDPERGFGFIVDQGTESDILLGIGTMQRFGWWTVARGSSVKVRVAETPTGLQAVEILAIVAPDEICDSRVFDFDSLDYLASEFVPARVIWYDQDRGYGFASTYGDGEDCFLHWRALEQAGLLTVAAGEALAVRIGRGQNGRVAASVRNWNAPAMQSDPCTERLALVAA